MRQFNSSHRTLPDGRFVHVVSAGEGRWPVASTLPINDRNAAAFRADRLVSLLNSEFRKVQPL